MVMIIRVLTEAPPGLNDLVWGSHFTFPGRLQSHHFKDGKKSEPNGHQDLFSLLLIFYNYSHVHEQS